ncbi:MAG: bacterial Ig-like domain-containing protein [Clostridia bacterium]|nr:bacterial Ig-like domain-containing protein [Clostridia bacterium]
MKRILAFSLSLALFLSLVLPTAVFAAKTEEESYVTQTSMVRALQTMLTVDAPLDSEYTQKSPYGGAKGSLGFAQTLFYRLFLSELPKDGKLLECEELTVMSAFEEGDGAQASTIPAARGALRFGDLIQYGDGGHISVVLGEADRCVVVYDCGFGGEDKRVRLRLVTEDELTEQALEEGRGGLYFFRCKNLPALDITLDLVKKPKTTSYYLESTPSTKGALLAYHSEQTGRKEIKANDEQLLTFASTAEAGNVPMLFLYGSAITFCSLEVKNETVESIVIKTPPTKLEYTTEEEVDMTGAVVIAKMLDEEKTEVELDESEYTVSYAFTAPGSATVTVSYGSKETTFDVKVKEPPITRLTVGPLAKTKYYVGERLDLTDAYIVVDYEKKRNVRIDLVESMLSAYDTSLPGELSVTVNYGGKTAELTVEIIENKIASLRLVSSLNKQYRKGASIDLAKVELEVLYEDGQTRTVTARDCEVKINGEVTSTFHTPGEAEVVFTYQNVSTGTVAVSVAEDPMAGIITVAVIILALLIGIPLLILLIVFLVRRAREKKAQNTVDVGGNDYEIAEEIASFDDEDDDMRIFEEKGNRGDTVALPKIATGVPSIRRAGDDPTIQVPQIPKSADSPTIRIPKLPADTPKTPAPRKIDFFDDL